MSDSIIGPLLSLPVLHFGECTAKKDDTAFPALVARRADYDKQIEQLVAAQQQQQADSNMWTLPVREACVDILLRFFNAANFVGDIAATVGSETTAQAASSSSSSSSSLSVKLQTLAPSIFSHFKCNDRDEMPASAFAAPSKAGASDSSTSSKKKNDGTDDDATGNSNRNSTAALLPPEPYRLLLRSLSSDGEAMETSVRRASLLAASVALAKTLPSNSIWKMRALFRHQLCLCHRSNFLYTTLMQCVHDIASGDIPQSQAPALALEMAHINAFYHRAEAAHALLQRAVSTSGLLLEETSFKGVRTRWMEHELPQLLLSAKSSSSSASAKTKNETQAEEEKSPEPAVPSAKFETPLTISSEASGHDILDRPRRRGETKQADDAKPLLLRDYAIILALCSHLKQNTIEGGLTTYQAQTYVERLIIEDDTQVPWHFRAMALLLRARLEYGRNRVQQRAFLQYQELIDSVVPQGGAKLCASAYYGDAVVADSASGGEFPRLDRCDPIGSLFYAVAWPSHWALRREYAERCFEDNLFKTAMELFEQTLDWPNIIKCCKELDRRNKAANLASDLLEEDPNDVMLWVALGEARRDEQPLMHAWELCKGMMAAPMRSLAKLALDRERYEDVIKYFDQSVRLNPIFGGDWFSLGYASQRLQHNGRASEAFTRVCQIEPDNPYAWTNLGALLMKKGKARAAFNAMSQALRHARGSWQIWDNYFKIGVEIKEVSEAAHALRLATKHSGQSFRPDEASLVGFARIAVQYIRGEIYATGNDLLEDEGEDENEQQNKKNNNSNPEHEQQQSSFPAKVDGAVVVDRSAVVIPSVEGAGENLKIRAHAVAAEEDADDDDGEDHASAAAAAGLQPLFAELGAEIDDAVCDKTEAEEKQRAADTAVRERFAIRARELMKTVGNTYTSHPVVHAACAEFFGALDGPEVEFDWRTKQVREATQEPLWERKKEALDVVIGAATAMARCAIEAEQKQQQQQNSDNGNGATSSSSATERPKKRALQLINSIVEKATPHFGDTDELRPLQAAIVKLKKKAQQTDE